MPRKAVPTDDLPWGRVIGLPVAVGDMGSITNEIIRLARDRGQSAYVCVANVHMLVTAKLDTGLRKILGNASIVISDGSPLVWRLRRQGHDQARQVRGPELMSHLCRAAAEEDIPVFFYGGSHDLIDELRQQVETLVPRLNIAGAEAAPMLPVQPEVDPATLERIRNSGAKIVMVSLGCPKQEFWMRAYSPHLDAVLIGVGQAFNITAGYVSEAPAWMRENGLEWLFRLISEPRRLWRRYLVTNTLFVAFLMFDTIKRRFNRLKNAFSRKVVAPPPIDHGAH